MQVAGPAHPAGFVVVPAALEVSREQRVLSRAGKQQIAAVMEQQGREGRVITARLDAFKPLVARQIFPNFIPKFKRDPVEETPEIGFMLSLDCLKASGG